MEEEREAMAIGDLGLTRRTAALGAGLGLFAMSVLAIVGDMVWLQQIRMPGDAAGTAGNLLSSASIFRAAILCLVFVLVLDVLVAWALFVFLEPVHAKLSLMTAWLRVVYAAILGTALAQLVSIAGLMGDGTVMSMIGQDQVNALFLIRFDTFYEVWGLGFIVFGVHLLALGILSLRSDYVPRTLGALLTIAGIGYTGEYSGRLLSPSFDVPLSIAGWGELVFMFWLLWVGRPTRQRGNSV